MVILYKDPKGEKIFERTHSVSQMTATNCNFDDLEKHCKELENRLGKYEVSLNSNGYVMLFYISHFLHDIFPTECQTIQ